MTNCPLRDGPRVLYGNVEDSRADIRGWAPREVPTSGARGINWPLRDVYRCTYTEPPLHNRRWEVRKASSRPGRTSPWYSKYEKGVLKEASRGAQRRHPLLLVRYAVKDGRALWWVSFLPSRRSGRKSNNPTPRAPQAWRPESHHCEPAPDGYLDARVGTPVGERAELKGD